MARQMVKKLLDGPLILTPKKGYYEFEGVGTLAKIVARDFALMVASPTGLATQVPIGGPLPVAA